MSLENNNLDNKEQESVLENPMNEIRAIEMEGYEIGVKRARNTLFVVAGLLLVGELISLGRSGISFSDVPFLAWAIIFVEIGAFIALGIFSKQKPYLCILLGIILFIGLWILNIVVNGAMGAIGGIIIRGAVLYHLITNLKDAKKLEEARKEIY